MMRSVLRPQPGCTSEKLPVSAGPMLQIAFTGISDGKSCPPGGKKQVMEWGGTSQIPACLCQEQGIASVHVMPYRACKHQIVLGMARAVPKKALRQTHFNVTTKLIDFSDGSNGSCHSGAKWGQSWWPSWLIHRPKHACGTCFEESVVSDGKLTTLRNKQSCNS